MFFCSVVKFRILMMRKKSVEQLVNCKASLIIYKLQNVYTEWCSSDNIKQWSIGNADLKIKRDWKGCTGIFSDYYSYL